MGINILHLSGGTLAGCIGITLISTAGDFAKNAKTNADKAGQKQGAIMQAQERNAQRLEWDKDLGALLKTRPIVYVTTQMSQATEAKGQRIPWNKTATFRAGDVVTIGGAKGQAVADGTYVLDPGWQFGVVWDGKVTNPFDPTSTELPKVKPAFQKWAEIKDQNFVVTPVIPPTDIDPRSLIPPTESIVEAQNYRR